MRPPRTALAPLLAALGLAAAACSLPGGTSTGEELVLEGARTADGETEVAEKDLDGIDLDELIGSELPGIGPVGGLTQLDEGVIDEGVIGGTGQAAAGAGEGQDIVVDGASGDLCQAVPADVVASALGGSADQTTGMGDGCTWVRTVDQVAAVVSLSVTDAGAQMDLRMIVEAAAPSIDTDGVAEAVDDVGDDAYLLESDLGTYLYAQAGIDLIVVFSSNVPDERQAGITVARAVTVS